ncbi:MAG: hypothetical protein JWM18_3092 [Chloroflexi bacterium]|jgi:hypothetical protein|nr:hypothetical protein [Chloroflexota bacterium]
MDATAILKAVPATKLGVGELSAAIDALSECERDATACAMAMAAGDGGMTSAIHAALDCVDTTASARHVLLRTVAPDAGVLRAVVTAARAAAERSATECGAHAGHHAHCRVHSESSRRAADACKALLSGLGG